MDSKMIYPFGSNSTSQKGKREISDCLNDTNKRLRVEYEGYSYIPLNTNTALEQVYNSDFKNNGEDNEDYFEKLPVETIVKIFAYCDPFSTPLLFVCKLWSRVLHSNHPSVWRDILVTITENRPLVFTPLSNRVISYFNNGYGRALHSFSLITSLSPNNKQISNVNRNTHTSNSSNSSRSAIHNSNSNSFDGLLGSRSISRSTKNTNAVEGFSINNEKINLADFIRSLSKGLAQCSNLKQLDITIPLETEQLSLITNNCPRLTKLDFNSILISDKGMISALAPLKGLEHLSIISTGQELIKQGGRHTSLLSPMSLHSISTLSKLKSLKFSLLPQFGNKTLVENGVLTEHNIPSEQVQAEVEKAARSLSNCKLLENLELMNCCIGESTFQWLLDSYTNLNRLVIYRNSLLRAFTSNLSTVTHLSLSCILMLGTIRIESNSLQELYIEGCGFLKSTELITPMLSNLSMEGCTGSIKLDQAYNIKTLSLFECPSLSQSDLEKTLDSLISLKELYIYLNQIVDLRICSQSLRKLDIEAWDGIRSCMLDCPDLEEFKASESSLESLYLKADHMHSIELDFCDQLRSAIVDVLTCRFFSFIQSHPTQSTSLTVDEHSQFSDYGEAYQSKCGRNYLSPMVLFLRAHLFIKECIVLSRNMLGKISAPTIGHLSIEQQSSRNYIVKVDKILNLSTYCQTRFSDGSKSPRFVLVEPLVSDYTSTAAQQYAEPVSSKPGSTRVERSLSPRSASPSAPMDTKDDVDWQPSYSYLSPVSPSLSYNSRNNKRYGK